VSERVRERARERPRLANTYNQSSATAFPAHAMSFHPFRGANVCVVIDFFFICLFSTVKAPHSHRIASRTALVVRRRDASENTTKTPATNARAHMFALAIAETKAAAHRASLVRSVVPTIRQRFFAIDRDLKDRDAAAEAAYIHERDMEALRALSKKVRVCALEGRDDRSIVRPRIRLAR